MSRLNVSSVDLSPYQEGSASEPEADDVPGAGADGATGDGVVLQLSHGFYVDGNLNGRDVCRSRADGRQHDASPCQVVFVDG